MNKKFSEIEENPALEQGQSSNEDSQNENQDDYSDEVNIDDYLNYDDIPSYKLNQVIETNQKKKIFHLHQEFHSLNI